MITKKDINQITKKYGIKCVSLIKTDENKLDITLDKNIYYKAQVEMENELFIKYPISNLFYRDII